MTDLCKSFSDQLQLKYDKIDDETNQNKKTSVKELNYVPAYQKSGGDGHQPAEFEPTIFGGFNLDAESLCSVDKMRIDQLISELDKCNESRNEMELKLAVSNSENEAIQKMIESWYSERESEERNLESELSRETKHFYKLTTNTSRSLGILTERISSWENETVFITETLSELLEDKIYLEKKISHTEVKAMLLKAEESRMRDAIRMDKLCSKKKEIEAGMKSAFDTGCRAEEKSFP